MSSQELRRKNHGVLAAHAVFDPDDAAFAIGVADLQPDGLQARRAVA